MTTRGALVGRQAELTELEAALDRARLGSGSLVLLAGEAGVGKTRLAESLAGGPTPSRAARAPRRAPAPRRTRRSSRRCGRTCAAIPTALADCGPLRPHLALLLPELGEPAAAGDRATVVEAVRGAFAHLARRGAAAAWSSTTCSGPTTRRSSCSPALARRSRCCRCSLAAYRSDGLPRDHALRRLRNELRRVGHLDELALEPLDAGRGRGAARRASSTRAPSRRSCERSTTARRGVPFFVEELAARWRRAAAAPGPRARARRATRCRCPRRSATRS